jgi:hypothetical protein
LARATTLAGKNPANIDIFGKIAPFRRIQNAARRDIDENGSLPYKPGQLSAMARFDRGGSFGPETACFGPASISGLTSLSGKIVSLPDKLSAETDP